MARAKGQATQRTREPASALIATGSEPLIEADCTGLSSYFCATFSAAVSISLATTSGRDT
jgi:hypothetical protein